MNGDDVFLPKTRQDPQSISRERQLFLDHHHRPFAFVDVPGSPKLSRLFTALQIHGPLPSVDPFSLSGSTILDDFTPAQETRDFQAVLGTRPKTREGYFYPFLPYPKKHWSEE